MSERSERTVSPGRGRAAAAVATMVGIGALVLTGCGGDDESGARPGVDDVPDAVAAVEAELGGPQRYFEINATPQLVNLFVAGVDGDGTVTPYVYAGGELQDPGPSSPVSGGTPFAAAAITPDLERVLSGVTDELPGSDVAVFVIYPDDAGTPRYGATVTSSEGGVLEVDLGADGQVLAVDPG